ncbi:MAG: PRC-barrel domain-containing protein [Coriobacteriia bacterium]|nr:PRC-barrel domain-containing protein [Coriobacteriia bacterium]
MRSLIEIGRLPVVNEAGKRIGRVLDVLFAPEGARVIGFAVARPRILMLLDRKDLYLALDRATLEPDRVVAARGAASWGRSAAARTGISWDDSVIWVGMPVRSESGASLGTVRDGLFDPQTGQLDAIGLTGGIAADIAVGVRDLPVEVVRGFDGQAVVLSDDAADTDTSGGAAAAAGRGVAVAKKTGSDLGKQATGAARTAAVYGASAVRAAAKSETGKKTIGWFKSIKDEVVDAMGDPDDDA